MNSPAPPGQVGVFETAYLMFGLAETAAEAGQSLSKAAMRSMIASEIVCPIPGISFRNGRIPVRIGLTVLYTAQISKLSAAGFSFAALNASSAWANDSSVMDDLFSSGPVAVADGFDSPHLNKRAPTLKRDMNLDSSLA